MGVIFRDFQTGKEVEWFRDLTNPYYARVSTFLKTAQRSYAVYTDGGANLPNIGVFVPLTGNLNALPAFVVRMVERHPPRLHVRYGNISAKTLKKFASKLVVYGDWVVGLGKDLILRAWEEDIEFAWENYRADLGDLSECEEKGFVDVGSDEKNFVPLKIAFAWQRWEDRKLKWVARAMETKELGIYDSMEEDNLRRICKKLGFLKPMPRK